MRICNNKDGFPDCCGGCYKDGICISKCKCEDSISVNEDLIKQLIIVTGKPSLLLDRKSTRLNSSHSAKSRMPSSA